ncbi:S66 family peptidase [Desmospora profundinema]|uniref:Muramoyltetrapeptide carboxypeptidase LdcA involved in peptidoglycan recycling n=1 Tax=Desmospora profundinema TaxID=1571184 RepID=A0ABU1IQZ7_9BACL|nr:LD-carboxypeptidase [Desmospora profundinema]MDR6227210.1 muramoyltetrapeptide carboxypeptidase LdcA involved in peptidoglycan recycling [Desmospora profundinema]
MPIPDRLQPGDEIRIVSPSTSLGVISEAQRRSAISRLEEMGLRVTFSSHVEERDKWNSSSVASRVTDLHEAFTDPDVKAIFTTLGGYNANQLLSHLDYERIRAHPTIFCGYLDITALSLAFWARSGLVSYSGPHFTSFSMEKGLDYTLEYFKRCVIEEEPYTITPADHWSDDAWYLDQENRRFHPNPGPQVVFEGEAEGRILGGNLCTFNLLQGTPFMPDLDGAILFLEENEESHPLTFDRTLQSLMHVPSFAGVRGLVIGRFQERSDLSAIRVATLLQAKPELHHIPVIVDASFGHTTPLFTFPIGGWGRIRAKGRAGEIEIVEH